MQEGLNSRQQVVERIRQSTSILVAVGNNPSVDALAASLGLSLMLNKMNKHTTAVFSGQTPPAIQFLEPNKLFENNVDALRDFIISLDKEKADRLRYKVEDDVVRIFITPYKTSISEKDLQYSQGDFNVDLIIALGVEKRDDLDQAIVSHGRILHDATVITVNPNDQKSGLGTIDWSDAAASSLCEMLVGISEAFQQPGLLDQQISTALLTGIVANTERFSNAKTSPRVMTMAAQLMAAGANQQLISTNLEKQQASTPKAPESAGPMAKQQPTAVPTPLPEEPPKKKEPGELDITHEKQPEPSKSAEPAKVEPVAAPAAPAAPTAEAALEAALPPAQVTHNMLPDIQKDLEEEAKKLEAAEETTEAAPGGKSVNAEVARTDPEKEEDYISSHGSWKGKRLEPPTLGGTLNATTEEAMEANKKAEDEDHNKVLLTHPNDAQSEQPRSRRNRRGKGGNRDNNGQQPQQNNNQNNGQQTPVAPAVAPLPPQVAPMQVTAPAFPQQPPTLPTPAPEPAQPQPMPAPALLPEPAPLPEPTPVIPPQPTMPEPAPAVPDLPPIPPVPQMPTFPAEPALPSAPAPLPEPAPAAPQVDDLNELHKEAEQSAAEAAAVVQPADSTASTIDSARQAVSDALGSAQSESIQPFEAAGAQAVPAMPNMPVTEPFSNDTLQSLPPAPVAAMPVTSQAPPASAVPAANDLPPLPPMPPLPSSDMALPPAPDLPGLNGPLPPMTPVTSTPPPAAPAPDDPRQYKIPGAP